MSSKSEPQVNGQGQLEAVQGAPYIQRGLAEDGYFIVRVDGHQWELERAEDAADLVSGLRDVYEVAAGLRTADPGWGEARAQPTEVPAVKRRARRKGGTELFIGGRGYLVWDSADEVQRTMSALERVARLAQKG